MQGVFSKSSSTAINREYNKKIVRILHSLLEMPQSIPFRKPVPHKALKLDDYRNIIKKPIDLNLIRRQNNEGQYKNVQEVLDDIQLCWDNCKLYNAVNSQIYRGAETLEIEFLKMIRQNFPQLFPEGFQKTIRERDIKGRHQNVMVEESEQKNRPIFNQPPTKQNKTTKVISKEQYFQESQVPIQSEIVPQSIQQEDNSEQQMPQLPPSDPIMVNLKLCPSKEQIQILSQAMIEADKNNLQQVLQILYTHQKELLSVKVFNQMTIPIQQIHLSTYMRICKVLKIQNGDSLIQ